LIVCRPVFEALVRTIRGSIGVLKIGAVLGAIVGLMTGAIVGLITGAIVELNTGANVGLITGAIVELNIPRSKTPGRKQPVLIVFRPFGNDCITAVFRRVVNDQIHDFQRVFRCF
jgi:hypothetical protein